MTKHTIGPFYTGTTVSDDVAIYSVAHQNAVCFVRKIHCDISESEQQANADFITKACNLHWDLERMHLLESVQETVHILKHK